MNDHAWLAERFEENRSHLRAVAYRMLGSVSEADDAVQEAWLRLSRSDTIGIDNLGGWLTTVVGRVCLDMLRSRKARREEPIDAHGLNPLATKAGETNLETDVIMADSVGPALLVVLEMLAPAERIAFILHDLFGVPFEEIGAIVGRSPAARQLASRARRRVQGESAVSGADQSRHREVVDAFLAASRNGNFDALLALLDPDVVLRADRAAVETGAAEMVHGASAVAETFSGRARFARPALIDGAVGAVWAPGGRPRVVFDFTLTRGKITSIDLLADPERLSRLEVTILAD